MVGMTVAGVTVADGGSRILRFLANGAASVRPAAQKGQVLLEGRRGIIAADGRLLASLAAQGVLTMTSHGVALSAAGTAAAARLSLAADALRDRHRDIELTTIHSACGPETVLANLAESPLAQLMRRKDKTGAPFLTMREYEAGERLRADYTRGQIMPRLGANWSASVSSGRRSASGGAADLTDAALAARQRVERAIEAVGPELSGVLVDICCFLKGFELVETERGWPVRSAKVVLKSALGALARHYFPVDRERKARPLVLHWGAEDYRPSISG